MSFLFLLLGLLLSCQGSGEDRSPQPKTAYDQRVLSDFFQRAAEDDQVFERFKQDPCFNLVHENLSYEQGLSALVILEKRCPQLLQMLDEWRKNDLMGSPRMYLYEKVGEFSPATLHYVALCGRIEEEMGDLTGKKIVQIGAGYGGLCRILNQRHVLKSYTIVDISSALPLAKRYLTESGVEGVEFLAIEELKEGLCADYVISDSSFFECNKSLQRLLLDKVVVCSSAGFFYGRPLPKHAGVVPYGPQEIRKRLNRERIEVTIEYAEDLPSLSSFNLFWKKS